MRTRKIVLLIFLIFLLFLLLSLKAEGERISAVSNGHLLKTENKDYYETWQAGAPIEMPANTQDIDGLIKHYAGLYGVDYNEMYITLKCESGFKHNGIYGDSGKAYGIAQFHEPTFNGFKLKAGMFELDYRDMEDQINLMAWAFGNGLKNHWTCWTRNFGK